MLLEEQNLVAVQFRQPLNQKNKYLQNKILNLNSKEESSESSKYVVYRVQLGIFDELIDVESTENLTTFYS